MVFLYDLAVNGPVASLAGPNKGNTLSKSSESYTSPESLLSKCMEALVAIEKYQ